MSTSPLSSRPHALAPSRPGPPGTGKTSVILGIVSALLATKGPPAARATAAATGRRGAADAAPAIRGMRLTGPPPNARVLVCAQSNAAIDEIVARLAAQGVWRADGKREPPGMVGRGTLANASPQD